MSLKKHLPLIAGLAVGLAALYLVNKMRAAASSVVESVGEVVSVADGVTSNFVEGIGALVALPKTECGACAKAMNDYAAATLFEKAYLTFSVSANCAAGDYFKWLANVNYRPVCKD